MFDALRARISRHVFNCFPAYRGTGGRITHIAPDWQEVRIELPLNWRTKNYVGTTYGGSMYGAVDPDYMMMLIRTLGEEYVVWDKEAEIRFKEPGRDTLYATSGCPTRSSTPSARSSNGPTRPTASTPSTSSTRRESPTP